MMRRLWTIAVLALPLLGLAGSAAWHVWRLSGAAEWRIPVSGYDPRDLLAGHYAQFRYDWQVEGASADCGGAGCVFCLEDRGGTVVARVSPGSAECANRVDPVVSRINVVWPSPGSGSAGSGVVQATGRIYIPEKDAARITQLLGQGRAVLVTRLGKGGQLTSLRIEPAS